VGDGDLREANHFIFFTLAEAEDNLKHCEGNMSTKLNTRTNTKVRSSYKIDEVLNLSVFDFIVPTFEDR
jgi:hypothetical protein